MGTSNQQLRQCKWEKEHWTWGRQLEKPTGTSLLLGYKTSKQTKSKQWQWVLEVRGVKNNRKGMGSSKCLGKWMLSWALRLFGTSWLQQVWVQVGEPCRGYEQKMSCLNDSPTVCFIMFCENVFSPIASVAGTWSVAALSRFYGKREGPKWKLSAGVSKSSHVSWGCAGHQVLLQLGHPSIPSQTELAFESSLLPL